MSQPSQADIYAALAAQSSFRKPSAPTAAYTDFTNSSDLIIPGSGPGPSRVNKTRVYCSREGCGSLILLEEAGEVVEVDVDVLPYDPASPFPKPTAPHSYIYLPTPFSFENIGYSRPDKNTTLPPGTPGIDSVKGDVKGKVKWLICAECDLGPVGWGFEGGQGGWVDMARVRYTAKEGKV